MIVYSLENYNLKIYGRSDGKFFNINPSPYRGQIRNCKIYAYQSSSLINVIVFLY